MKQILTQIGAVENLDLEEAAEFTNNPEESRPAYPFGSRDPVAPSRKRKAESEAGQLKGSFSPSPDRNNMKFSATNKFWKKTGELTMENILPENLLADKWKRIVEKLEAASIAAATGKKYKSGIQKLEKFSRETGTKISWPLTEQMINGFIVWCFDKKEIGAETVRAYLGGFRTVQNALGVGGSKISSSEKILTRGMANLDRGRKRIPKDAFTFSDLEKFRTYLAEKKNWQQSTKRVFWAVATVAFFSSCRIGELLAKKENTFDPSSDLLGGDVRYWGPDTLEFLVKIPKVAVAGGDKIFLFRFPEKKFCPIRALENLPKTEKNLPVFRFGSGKNLTPRILNKVLAGFGAVLKKNFTGKSFRAGIASTLEANPELAADSHIKAWGRWKSKAFTRYMKAEPAQKKWIFDKIVKAVLMSRSQEGKAESRGRVVRGHQFGIGL